jgi:vacuolar-type H+-ATPase subunit I/STV1
MVFREPGIPQKNNELENLPKEEHMDFKEQLKAIESQISLINAVGDNLDKESKLEALKIIGELKNTEDPEKRKESVSDLRTALGMIDVWDGNSLDKDAKSKALELIEAMNNSLSAVTQG